MDEKERERERKNGSGKSIIQERNIQKEKRDDELQKEIGFFRELGDEMVGGNGKGWGELLIIDPKVQLPWAQRRSGDGQGERWTTLGQEGCNWTGT